MKSVLKVLYSDSFILLRDDEDSSFFVCVHCELLVVNNVSIDFLVL